MRVGVFNRVRVADLAVFEAAVQRAQVELGVVVGLVVEVQTAPGALATDVVHPLLEAVEFGTVGKVPGTGRFDVVRAKIALVPAQGCRHTEVVDAVAEAEAITDGARHFGAGLVGVLVVTGLGGGGVEQAVVVKGRQALHVDRAAQRVGVHVRGQGFDHRQRLHQLRGQHVEGNGAAFAFRGRHQRAVDGHTVQVRAQAAHADETTFALIALDTDARQALYRFGDVGVRQLRDAIGVHHALDGVRIALLLERLVQAHGLPDHFNVFSGTGDRSLGGAQAFAGNGHGQCTERKADPLRLAATLVHVCSPPIRA